jgi:hypothetical protein
VGRADGVAIDGDPDERDFEALFTCGGNPIGGLAVDRPRAVPRLKRRIESGHRPATAGEEAA